MRGMMLVGLLALAACATAPKVVTPEPPRGPTQAEQREALRLEQNRKNEERAEAERLAREEKARAHAEMVAAMNARAAELDEAMAQPKVEALLLSVLLCEAELVKTTALAGIRQEKEAAKIAGVVSNSRLYVLQQAAYSGGNLADRYRQELRRRKAKPTPCDEDPIPITIACRAAEWDGEECVSGEEDASRARAIERAFYRLSLE